MRKILIVSNMQNDLIEGEFSTKHGKEILPNVVEKIKNFQNGLLYLTMTSNDDSYFETEIAKTIPEKYCVHMSRGWLVHDDIFNAAKESGCEPIFFEIGKCDTDMSDMIRQIKNYCDDFDNDVEVEICGIATEIGVICLALTLRTFCPFVKITIDSDCCAGLTKKTHKSALSIMNVCGINVIGNESYNKLQWENREAIQNEDHNLD